MPELPEVETIRRQLTPYLVGNRLQSITVLCPTLRRKTPGRCWQEVINQEIVGVERRGKYLLIILAPSRTALPGKALLIHLRMTGSLVWENKECEGGGTPDNKSEKHLRAILKCEKGCLKFSDIRRMGDLRIIKYPEEVPQLGVEPLSAEFNHRTASHLFQRIKRPVKPVLLDQQKIAGVGNIYASEILFAAGIDPRRIASTLSLAEVKRLVQTTKDCLRRAIKHRGTTISDYRDGSGAKGNFQHFLQVYGKEGEICPRCKTGVIQRIIQQQRSTFFCPHCQK